MISIELEKAATQSHPRTAKAANLPLAARACVGHIDFTGDVAEWLKAAVC
jgi:hypothetical protein